MGINNNFLLRGILAEENKHSGVSYSSPDIIGHTQVADPKSFFKGNYSSDPNEGIDPSRQFNTTYVRTKNLAASNVVNTGYVHLYQCGYSLFMKPSEWLQYRMKTMRGQDYIVLTSSEMGEIVVGEDCFQVSNKDNARYCLAAVVSDSEEAHIPSDFKNYDEYVYWVCTNPGVTFRNLRIVSRYNTPTYEQSMRIEGIGTTRLGLFYMRCENLPFGTIIRMEISALGVDIQKSYDGTALYYAGDVPAALDTYLIMSAKTADGKWPANAMMWVEYRTAVDDSALSYRFGITPEELGIDDEKTVSAIEGTAGPIGRLILIGACGTKFIA